MSRFSSSASEGLPVPLTWRLSQKINRREERRQRLLQSGLLCPSFPPAFHIRVCTTSSLSLSLSLSLLGTNFRQPPSCLLILVIIGRRVKGSVQQDQGDSPPFTTRVCVPPPLPKRIKNSLLKIPFQELLSTRKGRKLPSLTF